MKKIKKAVAVLLATVMAATGLTGCGSKSGDTIVVGSKQFTESIVLGELFAQLVENKTDLKVERKFNLGATSIIFPGLEKGEVDCYAEYTGTCYYDALQNTEVISPDKMNDVIAEQLEEKGIKMLSPLGLNNTFALGMKKSLAEEMGVTTLTDLAAVAPELVFGINHTDYADETGGYDDLIKTFGYEFKDVKVMDTSLLYEGVANDELDVIMVYATDGTLSTLDMVTLKDDTNFFDPYYAVPLVKEDILEAHPELEEVLNSLAGLLDDATMQKLNSQVDDEKRSEAEVAEAFLKENGLID